MPVSGLSSARARAKEFCEMYGIEVPILLAPMAGACPIALSAAVTDAGGMGAMGALLTPSEGIAEWCEAFRRLSQGSFQLNLWIPDPPPARDAQAEEKIRRFLAKWGPEVGAGSGDMRLLDFGAQCAAMLAAKPRAISSIMGIYPPEFVQNLKTHSIAWFATATTLSEALLAQNAGAAKDKNRIQAWAGQSAAMARAEPAGDVVRRIWREADALLP